MGRKIRDVREEREEVDEAFLNTRDGSRDHDMENGEKMGRYRGLEGEMGARVVRGTECLKGV